MRRALAVAALAAVMIGSGALYLTRLSVVPPHLMHDEVNFSLQAHAIATTGRDTNGRLLPVYFSETGFEAGRDPLMIYWTAGLLALQPLTEVTVRLPTAFLAVLSVGLMFIAARRLLGDGAALVAAAFLALAPGYFVNARLALSITYGIPLALLWLWCVARADALRKRSWMIAAGACLGLGVYSYLANMIVMPALLLVAMALLWRQRRAPEGVAMAAGFALLLLPLSGWLIWHPDRFTSIATAYTPANGGGVTMSERLTAFWMFFSPDYLFISGDGRMTNSTRAAGLFPLAFAILIPLGLYRLATGDAGLAGRLVATGFLLAPIATAMSGRLEINRVLIAIPFGVLAAATGAACLASRRGASRVAATVLVLGAGAQFPGYYAHYNGAYRMAASAWFGGDNRAAINHVLDRMTDANAPRVYLDGRTPIERYWRFYAIARGRADLAEWPIYYGPGVMFADAPVGSLVVCESMEEACGGMDATQWTLQRSVARLDGAVTHRVYLRSR